MDCPFPGRTRLNPAAAIDAESKVEVLSGAKVTDPVVETAKNRAHIQRNTNAALELGIQPQIDPPVQQPFNGLQQQLQNFYQQLDQRLARMEAKMTNTTIASSNRRSQNLGSVETPLRPPRKYIEGDGHALALAICGKPALPDIVQQYHPNGAICDTMNPWIANISTLTLQEILKVVVFYNSNFGINVGDTVDVRREKVRRWLCQED